MEVDKIRNLGDEELTLEERKTAEQLFRLRFQMKLGQTEGAKKLRELRKDIARIKTVVRQRELGIGGPAPKTEGGTGEAAAAEKPAKKRSAKPAAKKTAAKKSGFSRKTASRVTAGRSAAKPSANKKKAARSASVKKG